MSNTSITIEGLAKKIQDSRAADTELQCASIDKVFEIVKTLSCLSLLETNNESLKKITFKIHKYLVENMYS